MTVAFPLSAGTKQRCQFMGFLPPSSRLILLGNFPVWLLSVGHSSWKRLTIPLPPLEHPPGPPPHSKLVPALEHVEVFPEHPASDGPGRSTCTGGVCVLSGCIQGISPFCDPWRHHDVSFLLRTGRIWWGQACTAARRLRGCGDDESQFHVFSFHQERKHSLLSFTCFSSSSQPCSTSVGRWRRTYRWVCLPSRRPSCDKRLWDWPVMSWRLLVVLCLAAWPIMSSASSPGLSVRVTQDTFNYSKSSAPGLNIDTRWRQYSFPSSGVIAVTTNKLRPMVMTAMKNAKIPPLDRIRWKAFDVFIKE